MTLGREPLQIVEIDMDRCSRVYGTAPCAAALGGDYPRKCYNTWQTCQDRTNYDQGTETLRFARNLSGIPKGQWIYPALQSVSTNPIKINPTVDGNRTGPFGKRARITVTLLDFPDGDGQTDPYVSQRRDGTAQTDEGGYNPNLRGTFFGKLQSRWPHYVGRALRVKEGYVGEDVSAMDARHYVISEWKGPDDQGRVTITAKDILDLADNDKAQCPAPSRGTIDRDLAEGVLTTLLLEPQGIGAAEYPASGRASIGREILSFTRVGDTLTITGRALDGTDGAAHSAGDTFQLCARWENESLAVVARDLLRDYAAIPSTFIPISDWEAEVDRWMAGYFMTRTIPRPVGVTTLMAELAALGPQFWWNDRSQKIRLRASRPVDFTETTERLTNDLDIVAGTMKVEKLDDTRLTQVMVYHGTLDFGQSVTDSENYARVRVLVDADAERDEAYGQSAIHKIHSPWLGSGNGSAARAVASRLLRSFRQTPRQATFRLDVKDLSRVKVGDVILIQHRLLQDETGLDAEEQMQVTSVEEVTSGHQIAVQAQTFSFEGRFGFVMTSGSPNYGGATEQERAEGCFVVPSSGAFSDGSGPYEIF